MALEIFLPNTGQGDCTFIKFPNGKNMLVDINKTDVDVDIIEFLRKKIPKKKHEDIGKSCRVYGQVLCVRCLQHVPCGAHAA